MRSLQLAAALLMATGCGHLGQVRAHDVALETGMAIVVAVDAHQTMAFTGSCLELNPVIGRCGDNVPVPLYFLGALALHATVSLLLPDRWRTGFQALTLGVQTHAVYRNSRL